MKSQTRTIRKPMLWEAITSFLFLIIIMAVGILVYDADPHIPMVLGTAFAALMALRLGYTWKQIEKSMLDGIYSGLQAVLILLTIGTLIGVWLVSGVVPTMIYYGLMILNPQFFLVATLLICSITSMATGTSWGTAGTIGIALMGISTGLGIPAPITAGAIISGAYFGDKMSPLSDTTNLAPAMAGTDVFTHIKFMIKSTVIAYAISIIFYLVIGFRYSGNVNMDGVEIIRRGITDSFVISPILFIPLIAVIIVVACKVPAIPGIFLGVILGTICAIVVQGASLGDIFHSGFNGFVSETGTEEIDTLLSTGGMMNMMYAVGLTTVAMAFGGIMEKTGQLEVIVERLIKFARSETSLVTMTIATTITSNATIPDQYLAVILPNRMFAPAYRKRGLHPKMLCNAVDSTGTLSAPLVPWNTCGAFMFSVLGVSAFQYAPWAIFNYVMPLIIISMTALGQLTCKIKDDPETVIESSLGELAEQAG